MAHAAHDHGAHGAHGQPDDGEVHSHVATAQFYWGIFGALICLTGLTVVVSYFDFGSANTVIALVVATMKASLVAAFFMHLVHDKLFNTICLLSSFAFLLLFFLFTYEDTEYRARVDETNGGQVLPSNGEWAPGGMPVAAHEVHSDKETRGAAPGGAPSREHVKADTNEHGVSNASPSEKREEGTGTPKAAGSAAGGH